MYRGDAKRDKYVAINRKMERDREGKREVALQIYMKNQLYQFSINVSLSKTIYGIKMSKENVYNDIWF